MALIISNFVLELILEKTIPWQSAGNVWLGRKQSGLNVSKRH